MLGLPALPTGRKMNYARSSAIKRGQVVIGETLDTIGGSDVAVARAPERERINQRFAQNDFLAGGERFDVPHALMRAGQVKVGVPGRRSSLTLRP